MMMPLGVAAILSKHVFDRFRPGGGPGITAAVKVVRFHGLMWKQELEQNHSLIIECGVHDIERTSVYMEKEGIALKRSLLHCKMMQRAFYELLSIRKEKGRMDGRMAGEI